MKKIYPLIIALFLVLQGFSQMGGPNHTCETAAPFCTGTLYQFPAGVNSGQGQPGPSYNCLASTPNPAWYYMKVLNPGLIKIKMHSEPSRDIDFCCWGPFDTQFACNQLTGNKVVDCSYSSASVEYCDITNAVATKYYILIITNYSNQPCDIFFEQVSGTGSTDCSILPPPCSNNSPICAGQTLQLSANTVLNATYHWTGPNGFTSSQQNPVIPNAQPVNSGNYYLKIFLNGQPSQDSSVTAVAVYKPVANAGNDTSITNGVFTTLHGSCSGGSGSYHYSWVDPALLVDPNVQNPTTVNLFTAKVFTVTATDDSAGCVDEDDVLISISGGALAVGASASPSTLCYGFTTTLNAMGSGGAGNYTYSWTGPNGFTSNIQNPVVQPEQTSTYTVAVNDGYNTSTGTITVTVIPLPVANAGINQSIPYGWYTYLNGSGSAGSGNYAYLWSPADRVTNPGAAQSMTTPLTATTIFSLVITDLNSNCVSTNPAMVTVEISGGPVNVAPVATPDSICTGSSTQIHALAGGGSGTYTYSWTSDPPGFTSQEPDPFVSPQVNTTYHVTISDGQNPASGSVQVFIHPQPQIHLGPPDSIVCIYNTVILDAGNPGATYLWSNGQTSRNVELSATGISTEVQSMSVQVTNAQGCMTESSINVHFDFSSCVGIGEQEIGYILRIYPNPSTGEVYVESEGLKNDTELVIRSVYGEEMGRYLIPSGPSQTTTLDLSSYPKGMYFILTGDKIKQAEKLILR